MNTTNCKIAASVTQNAAASSAARRVRPGFSPLPLSYEDRNRPMALIADDDDDVRQMLRICMEMNGFYVREASRGMQVLANLHLKPDVILLDLSMPGLNGEDCLADIHKRCPGINVIVISGRLDIETSKSHMDAYECLAKPVDVRKLMTTVIRATNRGGKTSAAAANATKDVAFAG